MRRTRERRLRKANGVRAFGGSRGVGVSIDRSSAQRYERWRADERIVSDDERPIVDALEGLGLHDFIGAARGDDGALTQQHQCGGESRDEVELVTHEYHGPSAARETVEQLEHPHLVRDVEKRRR